MRDAHTTTGNPLANIIALLSPKNNNRRVKLWVLSFCGIASLMALGFGMFWEGDEVRPGESPEFSVQIATQSETAFSIPPNSNNPSSPKAHSSPNMIPPQEFDDNEAGDQKPQPLEPSVANDKQVVASRPLLSHSKPSSKNENLSAKIPISQSTDNPMNHHKDPAPLMLQSLKDSERLSQGSSFVKKRSYLEAIKVLEPLFAAPPEEWEIWFWMGTAQLGVGRYTQARDYFREGLARDETIPELWVQCALAEYQRGKYSQALSHLRQAEILAPNLPQVQLNLGFTLERQGNTSSALRHYRHYLSLTNRNLSYLATRQKVLDRILNLEGS